MLLAFSTFFAAVSALQTLPPIRWAGDEGVGSLSLSNVSKTIYIDSNFASRRDENGLTLIPPSALEFAKIFLQDLEQITGESWSIETVDSFPDGWSGIFLGEFRGSAEEITYENGDPNEEGYELEIAEGSVFIGGTGARGMWWGTRTLLQQLLLSEDGELSAGRVTDAPAYATRGYLLDCGRKYYSLEFLKDLCTYASFFKISEFQYHLMDNYPLNRGRNETWYEVYSHFSLIPENPELDPLVDRRNESLSRAQFEDLQQHCVSRGITIVPEIEAPGHALVIAKWKPELALEKKDLLNLTHPDAIPTVKSMWDEFLPWFQTKEVHIGADEYDPELADDYITFVNEMNDHIKSISGKDIRIWGTYEPSENLTINTDIIIQHWQIGQSEPAFLEPQGYRLINSEDWVVYVGLKNDHMPILPRKYPQWYNISRTLNFADQRGWQWEPTLFDPFNTSAQLKPGAKGNKGAIMAAWNDNGPDATTQLEAFYSIREGIPVLAARAWSGTKGERLEEHTLTDSIKRLTDRAPGQNLDRRLPAELDGSAGEGPLLTWERQESDGERVKLGYGGKGLNHELILEVTGPFKLSSNDSTLALTEDGSLIYSSDNWPYPLRHVDENDGFDPGHPGRIWVNATSSSHEVVKIPLESTIKIRTDFLSGSRVWINDEFAGRFEVFVFGGRNTQFSWSQMAFVAPLNIVEGGIQKITVNNWESDGPTPTDPPGNGGDGNDDEEVPEPPEATGSASVIGKPCFGLILAFVFVAVLFPSSEVF
ncbi:hypothetical protein VTO42DRAFT_7377 [Malbranchea cinnamomea]